MKIFGKELTQEELGRLMQEARERKRGESGKRISREMMGKAIGVDQHTIYEWERGNKHPGFLNVCKFCDYLDITLDELLGVKKTQHFHILISEEERDDILSLLDECQHEAEISDLYKKLDGLEASIKTVLGRVHTS